MSSCCEYTSGGGLTSNQDSSEPSTSNQHQQHKLKKNKIVHKLKSVKTEPTEYTQRLRPRPTRQTEHFRTIFPSRRLALKRSSSEFDIASNSAVTADSKKVIGEETPSTSIVIKRENLLSKNTQVKEKPADRSTGKEKASAKIGKRKAADQAASSFGVKSKKKLASQTEPERKTASEESSKTSIKPSTSAESASSSKTTTNYNSNAKGGAKPKSTKVTGRFPLPRKTKSAETKSRLFSKHIPGSGRFKSLTKGEASSSSTFSSSELKGAKSTTGKTGSCASSRRGSERGKRSAAASGSSDRPATDDGCGGTSNNQAMRTSRSRNSRDSAPSQRNSTETRTENNETGNASTVRTSLTTSGPLVAGANAGASSNDSETEDSDITRLQALLEARGLPPHFFGNLGPRMQQILHRSMGSGSNSKAQQYLQGMQAVGDESRQLQAAIGMCQLLVMGNEDTLVGFPVKNTVPALITLLKMEHNFDLMNHACRALTYMMEALPRSSAVVVDAIPVFLEKLQVIQCMDVAEQSLTALNMLSRRHAPSILTAGGLSSCLLYIDFFSLPAQRSALAVAANCCLAIGTISTDSTTPEDEFNKLVKSSLPLLSGRLTHHDKKCVESACMCFVRLVDNYQQTPKILATLSENSLFSNIQQLLVVTPPLLSSGTFVMIIRTMTTMCSNVRTLAIKLVKDNIADTLKYLLCGTATDPDGNQVELVSRSPQELYEITSLIGELLPKLPLGNQLFSINHLLWQSDGIDINGKAGQFDRVAWQWKDESNLWRPYIRHDSMMIEAAHASGEQEVSISTMERSYTIDFESMQQINDDTGTSRAVQRVKSSDKKAKKNEPQTCSETGVQSEVEESSPKLSQFITILFKILYEVYSSSAGSPAVRHRCLRAIQRMVYYTQPTLLSDVLKDLTVSSHISSMLSSPDIKVVVGALQLAEMLMQKLPEIFADLFHREGVLHQVKKLTEPMHPLVGTEKTPLSSTASSRRSTPGLELESPTVKSFSSATNRVDGPSSLASMSRRVSPPLTKAKAFAAALTPKESDTPPTGAKKKTSTRSTRASRSSTSSFLSNLNPTKWGRSLSSALSNDSSTSSNTEASETVSQQSHSESKSMKVKRSSLALPSLLKLNPTSKEASDMEKVKEWIRNSASKFIEEYFTKNLANNNKQTSVLEQMTQIAKSLFSVSVDESVSSLKELCSIVSSIDVSSFELQHSGLINSLLQYLTSHERDLPSQTELIDLFETYSNKSPETDSSSSKDFDTTEKGKCAVHARIRYFLHVFAGLPISPLVSQSISSLEADQIAPMQNLVRKLNQCVAQLEQLPVKTHDLTSGGAQALRAFSTRQLKCQLQRHPDCHQVKQWLGGPVKVDPLVQVQAIERYLVARGYGVKSSSGNKSEQNRQFEFAMLHEDEDSEDEIQEDDEDELSLDENTSDCLSSEAESHTSNTCSGRASSSTVAFGDQSERRQRKTSAGSLHKLDFYIGNHKLPHHITVYQAVRQYSSPRNNVMSPEENLDLSMSVSDNSGVWNKTHVIRYKLIGNEDENNSGNKAGKGRSSKKLKTTGKHSRAVPKSNKMNESLWADGLAAPIVKPLDKFLVSKLPSSFTTVDACSEVLCLLRVVHAISRYWYYLYSQNIIYTDRPLVPQSEFTNIKINAKCTRQLQDPLIIITGQLPNWLQEIATVCPFLLSFETRQLLFKITAFDRDRAMQHLLDIGAAQELSTAMANASNSGDNRGHTSGRFMPRIEKKKCSVSRENLLLQAEKIIFDYGHSKSMIEVDYEGEVGTGLGPTLEFFTLVSKEFQKSILNLWREELTPGQQPPMQEEDTSPIDDISKDLEVTPNDSTSKSNKDDDVIVIEDEITSTSSKNVKKLIADEIIDARDMEFVNSPTGLFPKPLGRSAKLGQVTRIKNKFRFLGKFMAKALLDGRMVDLPFSLAWFKWLINQEISFTGMDLAYVDPGLALTFNKLKQVVHQCEILKESEDYDLESVTMDGCPIEDLGLDMQLPGYPYVELMKGGKNISVTIHNLDKYLNLITHWSLYEGTKRQFEAMKEGFESVFPLSSLNYFYPEEMDQLFCGSRYQPWSVQDLAEAFHPDHGYTQDSLTVKTLYRILAAYDLNEQRSFLQFVTGCPHLPVGGFMALNPRLTIVRKTCEDAENVDDYLPSVMTCLNYLKLPDYSTEVIMRAKLQLAAAEGQKSFLLS